MNEPKKTTLAKTQLGWSGSDKTEISSAPWGAQQPYAHLLESQARGSVPAPHHQVHVHQDYVQAATAQDQQVKQYPEDPYAALAAHYGQPVQPARTNANVAPRRAKGSTPPPARSSKPLFNDPTKPHAYNMQSYATEYEQATTPLTAEQYQQQQQHLAQHPSVVDNYAHAQYDNANAAVYAQHAQTHHYAQDYSAAQYVQHAQQADAAAQYAAQYQHAPPAEAQYAQQDYTAYAQQLQVYAAQQEAYAQQQAQAAAQQEAYAQQAQAYAAQQEALAQQQAAAQQYAMQQEAYAQQQAFAQQQAAAQQQTFAAQAQYTQQQEQAYAQHYYSEQAYQQQQAQAYPQYDNQYAHQYAQQVQEYEQKQREETKPADGNYLGNMAAKIQKRAEKQKAKLEAALKKESKSGDKRDGKIAGANATVDQSQRRDFIKKTYKTLFFAILAFSGLLWSFRNIDPLREMFDPFVSFAVGGRWNWGVVLAAFVGSSIIAERWSHASSRKVQYMGLGFYVLAEAVIFVPLMAVVEWKTASIVAGGGGEPNIVRDAAIMTLAVFGALTASVVLSKKDFSFLRSALYMASGVAITLVVMSLVFGFGLGLIFSVGMVVLAGGYILYQTSRILAHHDPEMHVSAALDLFSSIALMFWYMIRIFMRARD